MIALLLALQAAGIDGTPVGALPRQDLPVSGCAAYLWTSGEPRQLVAMASASPAQIRMTVDGKQLDLPRDREQGAGALGFAGTTHYKLGDVAATLDLTIETRASLAGGAVVPSATLSLDRPGRDSVVLPVAGLIGCAAA